MKCLYIVSMCYFKEVEHTKDDCMPIFCFFALSFEKILFLFSSALILSCTRHDMAWFYKEVGFICRYSFTYGFWKCFRNCLGVGGGVEGGGVEGGVGCEL